MIGQILDTTNPGPEVGRRSCFVTIYLCSTAPTLLQLLTRIYAHGSRMDDHRFIQFNIQVRLVALTVKYFKL
jgi:hypothetical protein